MIFFDEHLHQNSKALLKKQISTTAYFDGKINYLVTTNCFVSNRLEFSSEETTKK